MSDDKNPLLRIPEDMEGVYEIAEEEEEDGMTDQQRRNLAEVQARIFDI